VRSDGYGSIISALIRWASRDPGCTGSFCPETPVRSGSAETTRLGLAGSAADRGRGNAPPRPGVARPGGPPDSPRRQTPAGDLVATVRLVGPAADRSVGPCAGAAPSPAGRSFSSPAACLPCRRWVCSEAMTEVTRILSALDRGDPHASHSEPLRAAAVGASRRVLIPTNSRAPLPPAPPFPHHFFGLPCLFRPGSD
jgi:hypothetical protein